jgi:acylphosphatase
MAETARVHAVLSGRVQGVAFRYYAMEWAREEDVTGWIRNLPDGRVEILAEGRRENLDRFLERVGRGPRMARVDRCDTAWDEPTGEFPDFRVAF